MKKDDIEAVGKDIDMEKFESYFDAVQAGDIEALIKIEKTVDNIKALFNYADHAKFKTAIELAAYYGHNHVIEHLINLGAEWGEEAMIAAIRGGQIDTMVYLNQGVPEKQRIAFNIRFIKIIFEPFYYRDLTLMHVAAAYNQTKVMVFLNEDERVPESERIPYNAVSEALTPMHFAAGCGQTEAMFFLNQNYKVPADQRTSYDVSALDGTTTSTPIHFAIIHGQNNAIDFLAKNLAKASSCMGDFIFYYMKSNFCPQAMHWAAGSGQIETMKFLANKGFRYNEKLNDGLTPMHYAASGGRLNVMEFLYSNPAVPDDQRTPYDVKTNNGKTPRDVAIVKGHTRVVDFLNKVLKSSSSNESTNVNPRFRNLQQNTINETGRNILTPQPPQAFGEPQPNVPLQNNTLIALPPKVSSRYDEILSRLEEQEKIVNTLLNQRKSSQNCSNQSEIKNQSPSTKNRNNIPKSSAKTNSNNKRPVARDKAKPTSSVLENNKRQKTARTTTDTVEALKEQGFLGQERKNSHQDQEIIYTGDYPHPLGGQSLDNLARSAEIVAEHPDEENEVDSVMKYRN